MNVDINVKNSMKQYIDLLSDILKTDDKLVKNEFEIWIPNCIECLQFYLDNEQLLIDKPNLYADILSILSLLYNWIFEGGSWAYIELYQKFKTIYSSEEIGNSFKVVFDRMNKNSIDKKQIKARLINNSLINYTNDNGDFKSLYEILSELHHAFELE